MAMNSNEKIKDLEQVVAELERAASLFNEHIQQPKWDGNKFRYEDPNALTYLVLNMTRMVAGFYAALSLIREGLFEDAGAIARVIAECQHDIDTRDQVLLVPELSGASL